MPLRDPERYRDPGEDWLREFRARRVAALRPLVTPALLEEHRRSPRGPHGPELQQVLNFVRGPAAPLEGRAFVHVHEPYRAYGLARIAARGARTVPIERGPFASEREAHHAAFLERLVAHGLLDAASLDEA
jgi:branched-chain amino acid transport system permease protein